MLPTMTRQDDRLSFTLKHDNAPVHTAKKEKIHNRNDYEVLGHPAQSPDFNLLENICWALQKAL